VVTDADDDNAGHHSTHYNHALGRHIVNKKALKWNTWDKHLKENRLWTLHKNRYL